MHFQHPCYTFLSDRLTLLAVSRLSEQASSLPGSRDSQLPCVDQLLGQCWAHWCRAEEERRRREEEEQSLYRYRSSSHMISDDDGSGAIERELERVSVDYRTFMEEVGEEEPQGEEETEGEGGAAAASGTQGGVGFTPDEIHSIASLHMLLYSDVSPAASHLRPNARSVTRTSYCLAGDMAQLLDDIPGVSECKICIASYAIIYLGCK